MKAANKGLLKFLDDALFPKNFTCDLCGIEIFDGGNLCPDCKKTVTLNNGVTCPVCGRKTVRPEICLECKEKAPKFSRGVSALVYEDGGVALIAKFKNGNGYLKEYFADFMVERLYSLPAADSIVYIPATKKSIRMRGYNQSKLLAKAISERTEIPLIDGALQKVKNTDEQKSLSRRERAENLKGCFKAAQREQIKGKTILLVDDVLTTGATADEACKALLSAGAEKVFLVTAASVEYKSPAIKKP